MIHGRESEGVASTLHTISEHVSSINAADAHTSAASSRLNYALADLNGLVRFAERRNLVSTRVPSHFKRSLQPDRTDMTIKCSKELMQFACRVTEARIQTHSHNIQCILPSYDKNGYANAMQCYVKRILSVLVT